MIVTTRRSLRSQTVYSPTRLPYSLPLAPTSLGFRRVAADDESLSEQDVRSAAGTRDAPITTPESSDVMSDADVHAAELRLRAPQAAPSPSGAATRWQPQVVARLITLRVRARRHGYEPRSRCPRARPRWQHGSVARRAAPWYKAPSPLVGLTLGGGLPSSGDPFAAQVAMLFGVKTEPCLHDPTQSCEYEEPAERPSSHGTSGPWFVIRMPSRYS